MCWKLHKRKLIQGVKLKVQWRERKGKEGIKALEVVFVENGTQL